MFFSFIFVSLTPSGNKLEYSRDLTILIVSFISSLDVISIVLLCKAEDEGQLCEAKEYGWWPDPMIFLYIPAPAADAGAVNPKGIKTFLANGLITFFISGYPVFSNGPRSQPRNPPDCIILDIWVFDNLISFYDLPAKALRRFTTWLLVNNNLWGNLVSSPPIIFDHNLKTTSVLFFIADVHLLSCEFDSFTFKMLYCVIYTDKN